MDIVIYEAFNVANHSALATTLKHYISEDTKRKSTIRLAELNSAVDRWAKTKGVIDPRNRQSGSDIFVATIGFDCDDPWNSPFEKKQRPLSENRLLRCLSKQRDLSGQTQSELRTFWHIQKQLLSVRELILRTGNGWEQTTETLLI